MYEAGSTGKMRQGELEGLVRDNRGYLHAAIHPTYSAAQDRRRRVLAFRVAISVLGFLTLLFSIIGQVMPFGQNSTIWKTIYTYTAWQEKQCIKVAGSICKASDNKHAGGVKALAILSCVFSLAGFILSAVYASCWHHAEHARRDEEEANHEMLAKFRTERNINNSSNRGGGHNNDNDGYDGHDGNTRFPYENERIANDRISYVPFEEAEIERRCRDRWLGIAAFSVLLAAALSTLLTVILMASFFTQNISNMGISKYREGLPLFIVAFILAVVAAVVIAVPPATGLYLCNAPPIQRADLMVVDSEQRCSGQQQQQQQHTQPEAKAGASTSGAYSKKEQRSDCRAYVQQPQEEQGATTQYHAPPPPPQPAQMQPVTNPYYPPNSGYNSNGMAVAQGIPIALPGPPLEFLPQQQQQQQQEYTSGMYYEAPPQLFNVNNNSSNGACKGKST